MNDRVKALSNEKLQQRYTTNLLIVEELVVERVQGNDNNDKLDEIMEELVEYKRELIRRDELRLLLEELV